MSIPIAVVYEAEADLAIATDLADRIFVSAIAWLEPDIVANHREWISETTDGRRLTWKNLKELSRSVGIRARGHFEGNPGLPDAAAARRAIMYLLAMFPELKAIVLIRDQDNQPDRLQGLRQARGQDRSGVAIVIGLAIIERESWVLSGFDPRDRDEIIRLEGERKALGFDPRLRSHELTAGSDENATRSPKRVLRALTGDDRSREPQCWREPSLSTLCERGAENGLATYLNEVKSKLASLIGHVVSSHP